MASRHSRKLTLRAAAALVEQLERESRPATRAAASVAAPRSASIARLMSSPTGGGGPAAGSASHPLSPGAGAAPASALPAAATGAPTSKTAAAIIKGLIAKVVELRGQRTALEERLASQAVALGSALQQLKLASGQLTAVNERLDAMEANAAVMQAQVVAHAQAAAAVAAAATSSTPGTSAVTALLAARQQGSSRSLLAAAASPLIGATVAALSPKSRTSETAPALSPRAGIIDAPAIALPASGSETEEAVTAASPGSPTFRGGRLRARSFSHQPRPIPLGTLEKGMKGEAVSVAASEVFGTATAAAGAGDGAAGTAGASDGGAGGRSASALRGGASRLPPPHPNGTSPAPPSTAGGTIPLPFGTPATSPAPGAMASDSGSESPRSRWSGTASLEAERLLVPPSRLPPLPASSSAGGAPLTSARSTGSVSEEVAARLVGHVQTMAAHLTDASTRLRKERTMRRAVATAYKELLAAHMTVLGATTGASLAGGDAASIAVGDGGGASAPPDAAAVSARQIEAALTVGDTEFDCLIDGEGDGEAVAGDVAETAAADSGGGDVPAAPGRRASDAGSPSRRGLAALTDGAAASAATPLAAAIATGSSAVPPAGAGPGALADSAATEPEPSPRPQRDRSAGSLASSGGASALSPFSAGSAALASILGGSGGLAATFTAFGPDIAALLAAVREYNAIVTAAAQARTAGRESAGAGAGTSAVRSAASSGVDVFGLEAVMLQRLIDVSHGAMDVADLLHHVDTAPAAPVAIVASFAETVGRRTSRVGSLDDPATLGEASFSALSSTARSAAAGGLPPPPAAPAPPTGLAAAFFGSAVTSPTSSLSAASMGAGGGASGDAAAASADFDRALRRFSHLRSALALPDASTPAVAVAAGDGDVNGDGDGVARPRTVAQAATTPARRAPTSAAAALLQLVSRLVSLLSVAHEYAGTESPAGATDARRAKGDRAATAKLRLRRATARVFRFLHRLLLRFSADLVLALNIGLRTLSAAIAVASDSYAAAAPSPAASATPSRGGGEAEDPDFAALKAEVTRVSQQAQLAWFTEQIAGAAIPPSWRRGPDAAVCSRCGGSFGLLTRKHHCRCCGDVFCHACSTHTWKLGRWGLAIPRPASEGAAVGAAGGGGGRRNSLGEVGEAGLAGEAHRVCDSCYTVLTLF